MSWNIINQIKKRISTPTADVATNANSRDSVGNKTDAAVTAVGTTKTLMAYIKGLVGFQAVPSANGTDNAQMRDVIGNKEDTLVTDVGTTKSISAYIKGVVQELDQRKTGKMVKVAGGNGSLADIVNITDKGILTGVTISMLTVAAQTNITLKITRDSDVMFNDTFITSGTNGVVVFIPIAFNHRFDTSLRIEGMSATNTNATCYFIATYTVDD